MAKKKKEKLAGGRPENWQEICMKRVPPWMGEPPKSEEAEAAPKAKKKELAKKEK
jgi:hypothetical protein